MEHSVPELGNIVITALRDADYQDSTIANYQKTINNSSLTSTQTIISTLRNSGADSPADDQSPNREIQCSTPLRLLRTSSTSSIPTSKPEPSYSPTEPWAAAAASQPVTIFPIFTPTMRLIYVHVDSPTPLLMTTPVRLAVISSFSKATESLASTPRPRTRSPHTSNPSWPVGKQHLSPWVASNLRPFFKYCHRPDLIDALCLINVARNHAVIPALTDEQCAQIIAECQKSSTPSRNAAITLLALTTGLRSIDIIHMTLTDIDWHHRTLAIIQHKTGNPLTVPLPRLLCQRVADYVLGQRPTSNSPEVFLRTKAPHTRLTDHSAIHVIITKTLTTAGIDRYRPVHNSSATPLPPGCCNPILHCPRSLLSSDTPTRPRQPCTTPSILIVSATVFSQVPKGAQS